MLQATHFIEKDLNSIGACRQSREASFIFSLALEDHHKFSSRYLLKNCISQLYIGSGFSKLISVFLRV